MSTKKKKEIKPQTLAEFKSWLDGVAEFQDEDWIPNKSQWANILERIDIIVADGPAAAPMNPMFPHQPGNVVPAAPIQAAPMPITGVPNPGMIAPQVPSSIPMPPAEIMSSAAKEMLGGGGKTPVTESGSESSFA